MDMDCAQSGNVQSNWLKRPNANNDAGAVVGADACVSSQRFLEGAPAKRCAEPAVLQPDGRAAFAHFDDMNAAPGDIDDYARWFAQVK